MRYTVNILEADGFCGIGRSTAEVSEVDVPGAIDAIRAEYPTKHTVAYSVLDRSFGYHYEFEVGPYLHYPPFGKGF